MLIKLFAIAVDYYIRLCSAKQLIFLRTIAGISVQLGLMHNQLFCPDYLFAYFVLNIEILLIPNSASEGQFLGIDENSFPYHFSFHG